MSTFAGHNARYKSYRTQQWKISKGHAKFQTSASSKDLSQNQQRHVPRSTTTCSKINNDMFQDKQRHVPRSTTMCSKINNDMFLD